MIEFMQQMPDWVERTLATVGGIAIFIGGLIFLVSLWTPHPNDKWKNLK